MSEVTYIWGAGASWGDREWDKDGNITEFTRGLPIVSELERALKLLMAVEIPYTPENEAKRRGVSVDAYKTVYKNLSVLEQACHSYPTLDTLAKQLFVTGDKFDEELSYEELKRLLATALLMMQDWRKRDLRYDGFIASLINEDKQFPDMTILSWNYDVQFELAFMRYFKNIVDIPLLWLKMNVYNKKYSYCFDSSNPFAMIKLNGSALFENDSTLMIGNKEAINIENCFCDNNETPYQYGYRFLTDQKYKDLISYAWEKDEMAELKKAIDSRIKDTRELIVIGYSFPYVNNELDRYILRSMPQLYEIVVQDKNFEDVKDRLESILTGRSVKIVQKNSLQQFYIPNRLMKGI